jgi:hypothetical protein
MGLRSCAIRKMPRRSPTGGLLAQSPSGRTSSNARRASPARAAEGALLEDLSSHLAKLEEAGYVEIEKTHRGKIPMTVCRLTKKDRASFRAYGAALRGALFEPANGAFGESR